MSAPTHSPTTNVPGTDGLGGSPQRPDGTVKVRGEFAYSSDLWHEDMVWGATLRSPHPSARIRGVDITEALRTAGVYTVLTHEDVPGENAYGLEQHDQPVLASEWVRYQGEPVALVAADHPETARRAMEKISVDYEVLDPVTDAEHALSPESALVHEHGNIARYAPIRHGDVAAAAADAEVVVTGRYEIGMQDQAFLGPESGLAIPAEDGGVDLYVATQWLHADQRQLVTALGLSEDKVRLTLGGVGGAFGGREDLSIQIHACMLALHTGKPVKMVYNREESFYGHVHRHPGTLHYEHGADRDGRIRYVKAWIYLDGGAYTSSTPAVVGNAAALGMGPYDVPNASMDWWGVVTNNPPCGAMRGFGAVQAGFAYESQLDKLADACGLHPVEVRARNAMEEGTVLPTGQRVDSAAPVAELVRRVADKPLPADRPDELDLRQLPGGVSNTTHGEGVVRGVGYAVGIKNICFSEGFDDYSTARVTLGIVAGELSATVQSAGCEVGQGLVTVMQQIVRTELGLQRVTVQPMDTSIGNGGSTSASRQTYVTGGAVRAACHAVRRDLVDRVVQYAGTLAPDTETDIEISAGKIVSSRDGAVLADAAEVLGDDMLDQTVEWRHRPTEAIDDETGQGTAHVQYGFAAHRAVVDVDTDLGLVKVIALDCAQDVGKAVNPQAVLGQIQGGSAQGLGLAVMEEIQTSGGKIRNPSFTDYLIPTVLDMPTMDIDVLERADPNAPYGLRGVGEPPTISATPAIVAAIRNATGRVIDRVPARPEDIAGLT